MQKSDVVSIREAQRVDEKKVDEKKTESGRHPRIKTGARSRIARRLGELQSQVEPILTYLDGNHEIEDISEKSGLPQSRVEWLVNELHRVNLVDIRESVVVINDRQMSKVRARALRSKRSVPDAIYVQLQKKIAPELSLLTWRDGVDDGGVEMLNARQRYEIEVSGISRALPSLIAILRASGVTQTHAVVSGRSAHDTVDVDDLNGSIFEISDIGGQYFSRLNERLKSFTLFGPGNENENAPFLHIHFGTPTVDQCSQWVQRGESYFVIHEPRAGEITLGPLVLPEGTPCIRCAELARSDQASFDEPLSGYDIPVAQSHLVAGFIADQVLRFIDLGNCEVLGGEITLDFLDPINIRHHQLTRHPLCGCAFGA